MIQVQNLQVHESMLVWERRTNQVRTHESTLIQKLKLNHKIGTQDYIHVQVQFHWSDNFPNCQCGSQIFGVYQVQDVVMKLNLGLNY